jgi:ABC-type Mn2+/Zn2+ transport system permease subunit
MEFLIGSVSFLIYPALIALIIYLIVQATQKKRSLVRDAIIGFVMISAFVCGIISLFLLPNKIMNISNDSIIFAVRLATGVTILLVGLFIKNKLQKYFLLILGLLMIISQAPYVVDNFGSYGALIIVSIAFIAIIIATVVLTRKHSHE